MKSDDKHLIEAARASVDQIWQAGLGAFARAQQEGGEVFSRLVQEGTAIQKRTQNLAEERMAGWADLLNRMADTLGRQASGSMEKLETAFEDRVARSLKGMGVPTRDDIQALSAQIRELQQSVDTALAKKPAARTAQKSAAAPARKRAAPKAVEKPAKQAGSGGAAAGGKRSGSAASHRT